ncbi:hypothetical protein JAAARDRAFT_28248 [Jaapia argillacea MUCL 33604]|uniref:PIN domain-containing protein n=1 Tax=Jaapia argillacea MUCL 33604 TaxID=933084 RepID=A0A067QCD1_9AGAM|nr:hypothetical protein JAAARDRAFT_28248 [Jaapia argillacea MUCL 33604]
MFAGQSTPLVAAEPHPPSILYNNPPSLDESDFRSTLERIANEDVEMRDSFTQQTICLVIDTNILLHHLEALDSFTADIDKFRLPVSIIIPGIVVEELDGQKKQNKDVLPWLARKASTWILEKYRLRRCVRGQAQSETCMSSGDWRKRDNYMYVNSNDDLIVDCCKYFRLTRQLDVAVCTGDTNLGNKCIPEGIRLVRPREKWTSHDISLELFRGEVNLNVSTGPSSFEDEDVMMIDIDLPPPTTSTRNPYDLEPKHAWDLLHREVISTFTVLLRELVRRVGGRDVARTRTEGAALSRYASKFMTKVLDDWDASDCLDYLGTKKPILKSTTRVAWFLAKPYVSGVGARIGRDWPRQDWITAVETLQRVASDWQDAMMMETLESLRFTMDCVLAYDPWGSS